MQGFTLVLVLAALPAAGNFLGGLLAEITKVSDRTLSLALHLAAGIVLAVVGLELMPEALSATHAWVPILALAAGGLGFMGLERVIDSVRHRLGRGTESNGPWAIFAGVSLDLFSDGIMIGAGTLIDPRLGLILALGQVPADAPEGFAAIATLRRAGVNRSKRILLALAFGIPVFTGAALGYFVLQSAPELLTVSVLAFTGGILISMVIEEMLAEAHKGDTSPLGPVVLTSGFALFALISAYL
ncbi:ZIP family metal transporter [Nesterenkonia sp. E16_7]|uniref:ZIP family metal transporter n=1 Tax=unclassified Nesterenkonia TaxID=2629769 RepID=UPI001A92656F|nr:MULTISPECIES: ZIP family metal transporter [unclassified Nesterenkonia]MBO0596746.1 ZIP family metal transporter [Nesterenkonia sp. E16_10]MBO0599967.1 ZIP family metal transporter [Nesterenkonia sp. E16_7]